MIRSELVQHLADTNPELSLREVEAIVSTFFDEIENPKHVRERFTVGY